MTHIRQARREDIEQAVLLHQLVYPPPFAQEYRWPAEQLANHQKVFAEGQICAVEDNYVIGYSTSFRTTIGPHDPQHNWYETTDWGTFANHDPQGQALYLVSVVVHPDYRRAGIGRALCEANFNFVKRLDLQRIIAVARLPGFHLVAHVLTAQDYIDRVVRNERSDPGLTFWLKCGFQVICPVGEYLQDWQSRDFGAFTVWEVPR